MVLAFRSIPIPHSDSELMLEPRYRVEMVTPLLSNRRIATMVVA
jgi:hypothetical protein